VFDSADADHFLGPHDMSRAAETPSIPGPTGLPPWLDLTVRLSRLPVVSIAVIRGASRGVGQEFACWAPTPSRSAVGVVERELVGSEC
jgi:hypothetical protein